MTEDFQPFNMNSVAISNFVGHGSRAYLKRLSYQPKGFVTATKAISGESTTSQINIADATARCHPYQPWLLHRPPINVINHSIVFPNFRFFCNFPRRFSDKKNRQLGKL